MSKSEQIYEQLSQLYTDEEIVKGFVFNDDSLSDEEEKEAMQQFRKMRLNQLKNMSKSEILLGKMMKLKLSILKYLESNTYQEAYSFGKQLQLYAEVVNKSHKDFAGDLGIHHTTLGNIANGKEHPSIDLMYRLEEHSRGEIPAHHWWRLHALELEYRIRTDLESKIKEAKKVKNQIQLTA